MTTDEAQAEAPQGKAARRKHGVLRHQLAKTAEPQDDTEAAGDDQAIDDASDEASTDDAEVVASVDESAAEPADLPLAPHRPAERKLIAAGIAAGVLFVGAGAFAGATVQPYLADRALVHNKFEVAQTAAAAVSALFTYGPDDMEKLPERSEKYLAHNFATEYRKEIDRIAPGNKQAKITNKTKVMGAAVQSIGPTDAVAIVYTNSVATSPLSKDIPSLRYQSYQLSMTREGSDWLVNKMTTLTQLNLTPQL